MYGAGRPRPIHNPLSLNEMKKFTLGARLLGTAIAMSAFTSCGLINEDLPECRQGVVLQFVYDHNMEYADAFYSQVDCLTVLVYDGSGNYVTTRTETSEALRDRDYRMTIDLPLGDYQFVAYGGMECSDASFHFVDTPAPGTLMTSNRVALDSDMLTAPLGTELHPLYYGRSCAITYDEQGLPKTEPAVVTVKDIAAYEPVVVNMQRDTNNVRIVLQQVNGEPMSDEWFDYSITDDNTLMAWNNDVLATSTTKYNPWVRGDISLGELPDTRADEPKDAEACFAEFSLPRLTETVYRDGKIERNNPNLKITRRSDGEAIVDIPLLNYLLATKSEALKMGRQEFLDRNHEYALYFFLDRNLSWLYVQIRVNNWTVRINNIKDF